ncbi:hypothetical protein N0B44_30035 [Roseibacterium beibuensis]|uniref:hypothetical protein n=1 Tax=[Roseibacterium] beibuensis TaxID=1193142 RepID=UPI00217F07A0|nr:hypothetical protein [Roseibacterium beibuensis]MCS6627155.1 hypothetical protein [Roseibacterium beibuensis]
MTRLPLFLLIGVGSAALAACSGGVEAPYEEGVCFTVELGDEGEAPAFHKLAEDQPQIEHCAARLEEMRLRFLRQGGSRQEVTGAYQGQYIFIDSEGVSIGKSLTGSRFFLLARTGDGRLAMPGAISRDASGRPVGVAAPVESAPAAPAAGQ